METKRKKQVPVKDKLFSGKAASYHNPDLDRLQGKVADAEKHGRGLEMLKNGQFRS